MAGDVIGIVQIYVGSTLLDCVQGSNIRLPGRKNTAVETGYRTRTAASYQHGEVNVTTVLGTGDDLDQFDPASREDIQARCDTGQVIAISDAILEQKPQISDNGGKAPLKWFFDTYTIQATS